MLKFKMKIRIILKDSKSGNITLSGMMILGVITTIMVLTGKVVTNNMMMEELEWRGNSILNLDEDVITRAQLVMDYVNNSPNSKDLFKSSFHIRIGPTNYRIGTYRKEKDIFEIYLSGKIIECGYRFESFCTCIEDECSLRNKEEQMVLLIGKGDV